MEKAGTRDSFTNQLRAAYGERGHFVLAPNATDPIVVRLYIYYLEREFEEKV